MIRIADILATRSVGRMQSVGVMQVIPILGEDDDRFAPPDVEAGTTGYGQVHLRNRQDRDTIVPPGSAWVVDRGSQDHALAGGALVKAGSSTKITNAMCVQQTQPGLIPVGEHALQILPARLRVAALRSRDSDGYSRLWESISRFKADYGLTGVGNLVDFLRGFAAQLDEFVAEFERVPDQVGAIVLVAGQVAGVEVTPSRAYWAKVWTPLIRICYGAVALAAQRAGVSVPETRAPLPVAEPSVDGIARALRQADDAEARVVEAVIVGLADRTLELQGTVSQILRKTKLQTVHGDGLIGQVVTHGRGPDRFKLASLTALRA